RRAPARARLVRRLPDPVPQPITEVIDDLLFLIGYASISEPHPAASNSNQISFTTYPGVPATPLRTLHAPPAKTPRLGRDDIPSNLWAGGNRTVDMQNGRANSSRRRVCLAPRALTTHVPAGQMSALFAVSGSASLALLWCVSSYRKGALVDFHL